MVSGSLPASRTPIKEVTRDATRDPTRADDKGILLPRLVMKLVVYGIALYFLKGKTKNENGELLSEKPGAEFSDRALWFTEKIKSLLGYDHKNDSTQNEL